MSVFRPPRLGKGKEPRKRRLRFPQQRWEEGKRARKRMLSHGSSRGGPKTERKRPEGDERELTRKGIA